MAANKKNATTWWITPKVTGTWKIKVKTPNINCSKTIINNAFRDLYWSEVSGSFLVLNQIKRMIPTEVLKDEAQGQPLGGNN